MKLKFLMEVEINDSFANIMDGDHTYWADLLQQRINQWRRTSKDDTAFKDFKIEPTVNVGKVWENLSVDEQEGILEGEAEGIRDDVREYARNYLESLPDEEMDELVQEYRKTLVTETPDG